MLQSARSSKDVLIEKFKDELWKQEGAMAMLKANSIAQELLMEECKRELTVL